MEANYGSSDLLWPPPAGSSVFEAVLEDFLARAAAPAPAVSAPEPPVPPTTAGLLDGWEALAPVELAVRLSRIDRNTLDGWAVIEYLKAADKAAAWAASLRTGGLGRFAELRPPRPGEGRHGCGHYSRYAAAEIAAALHLHHGTAARILAEAAFITAHLPRTFAAMEAGLIDTNRAGIIAGAAADLPADAVPAFEETIVPAAPGISTGRLTRLAGQHRNTLHPVPLADRHTAAKATGDVTARPLPDAMGELCAVMPAGQAADCYRVIDTLARSLQGPAETRRIGELRGVVLHGLITGAAGTAGSAPGGAGGGYAVVTVSLLTLLGLSGDPGTIPGFGEIPPSVARDLAGLAKSWLPVLTDDGDGRFLRAARRKRTPPKGLRRWIQLRDSRCRVPGCDRPAPGCDIDHITAWEDGGPTTPENLQVLCPAHHRLKHEAGWQVRQLSPGQDPGGDTPDGPDPGHAPPGGRIEWTTPTGHRYTEDPPPF